MATPESCSFSSRKEGIEVNLQSYEYGETALMIAPRYGHFEVVGLLRGFIEATDQLEEQIRNLRVIPAPLPRSATASHASFAALRRLGVRNRCSFPVAPLVPRPGGRAADRTASREAT